jgi:hypothetical protein
MKFKNNKPVYYLLLITLLLAGFSMVLPVYLFVFGPILILLNKNYFSVDERTFFYLGLIVLSSSQLLFVFSPEFSFNHAVNTCIALLFWVLGLIVHLILKSSIKFLSLQSLYRILDLVFWINILLIAAQYALIVLETKSLNPFGLDTKEYGMSTGDFLRGLFSNSSVTMVILSLYTIYYTYKRNWKVFLAATCMLFTTYMSGILIFTIITGGFIFFAFQMKTKVKILVGFVGLFFLINTTSPENIEYGKKILTEKVSSPTDPARKLVSFKQTLDNWTSSPKSFVFGEGAGKFSSRTAFLTGGDYTDWYPKELVFKSEKFNENHFKLWNKIILSVPFRDGTHNQPFSFYNQLIGEFGLLGLLLFSLYLFFILKRWHLLTYGKILSLLMIGFFFLEYWFDYFSVILFFEFFINLNIRERAVERAT